MTPRAFDPNLPALRLVAAALGDITDTVVFVGGAVAGLLITDSLSDPVRATRDVDAVLDADRTAFRRIEKAVAARGFARDVTSDVICRWVHRPSGITFDLMPVDADVLGFTNRWYAYACDTANPFDLGGGLTIRLVTALAFVATKLEAFESRGASDVLTSHDLEDVLNIVDGRPELAQELRTAPKELRQAITQTFTSLLSREDFRNALPGLITDSSRAQLVWTRLQDMSG